MSRARSRSPQGRVLPGHMGQTFSEDAPPSGAPSADGAVEFFEGTEKRIEIDFSGDGDLRKAALENWEEVVRLSETKILLKHDTHRFTSFLLSESSLIVYPGKAIIKTCGRTVPLNSISKLLEIGAAQGLEPEWLSYSRRNFLEPDDQPAEYRCKETEMALCRQKCGQIGDAYVLGPLTGDHWLLYDANFQDPDCSNRGDLTVDIMMYDLPTDVQKIFFTDEPEGSKDGARVMTNKSGIGKLASMIGGDVCDYCFDKCGYSCNVHAKDAYFMVHCTPQEGCSYASFETNFGSSFGQRQDKSFKEPLNDLVREVLNSFRPAKVTMTVFVDAGAQESMGGAPFEALVMDYRRKSKNSYHFEYDYTATVAHYTRKSDTDPGSPIKKGR